MRGVPRARRAISSEPSAGDDDAENAGAAIDDLLELRVGIKIKPYRNAERSRNGLVSKAGARGRADKGEFGEIDLHRTRRRSRADDEIELKILHRRVKDLLDRRIEPVNLVDERARRVPRGW